jgi:hypothetical protein
VHALEPLIHSHLHTAATKNLPSNDFRFERGGSQGTAGGRGPAQESDDLRAYAIRCVEQRHVCWQFQIEPAIELIDRFTTDSDQSIDQSIHTARPSD